MATEAKKKKSFMEWYESYSGKKAVGMVYSIGASVVIIGALFKILHWPGASVTLMMGMFTEAFLFVIGCLDKPHVEYRWDEVFPQLVSLDCGVSPEHFDEMSQRVRPTLLGAGSSEGDNKGMKAPAQLKDEDIVSMSEGIKGIAKTAQQLQELSKVAVSGVKLSENMDAASAAAQKFVAGQDTLVANTATLGQAYAKAAEGAQALQAGTAETKKNIESVNAQIAALNSVYELQLKSVEAQVEAYKAQAEKVNAASKEVEAMTANVTKMNAFAAESLKSGEAYKEASKKLADQVADLNKVYGNMLNALA